MVLCSLISIWYKRYRFVTAPLVATCLCIVMLSATSRHALVSVVRCGYVWSIISTAHVHTPIVLCDPLRSSVHTQVARLSQRGRAVLRVSQ